MGEPLTTTKLARLAGVHPTTILKAVQSGRIEAHQTPGGHFRIQPEQAERFLSSIGVDPGPLSRRSVRALLVTADGALAEALADGMRRDARFEFEVCADPVAAGIDVERMKPDIVVLDSRLLNGSFAATQKTLWERDILVMGIGETAVPAEPAPDAWLQIPFSMEEFLDELRELARGTRVWKRAATA